MSNETDLDWLARNVHEWREGANYVCVNRTDGGHVFHDRNRNCAIWFTKAKWLARRAELQNKPSWEGAPEWAELLAQDDSGEWYWYASKTAHPGMKSWWPAPGANNVQCGKGEVLGDWRDTLEKRPEEFKPSIEEANRLSQEFKPFTSIEDNQEQEMKQDNGWFERGELPPVGMGCTAVTDGIPDANCIIIAISTEQVVVKWTENQMFDVLDMPGWSFRPIRTERDKLVELIKTYRHTFRSDTEFADAILAAGFKRGAA